MGRTTKALCMWVVAVALGTLAGHRALLERSGLVGPEAAAGLLARELEVAWALGGREVRRVDVVAEQAEARPALPVLAAALEARAFQVQAAQEVEGPGVTRVLLSVDAGGPTLVGRAGALQVPVAYRTHASVWRQAATRALAWMGLAGLMLVAAGRLDHALRGRGRRALVFWTLMALGAAGVALATCG